MGALCDLDAVVWHRLGASVVRRDGRWLEVQCSDGSWARIGHDYVRLVSDAWERMYLIRVWDGEGDDKLRWMLSRELTDGKGLVGWQIVGVIATALVVAG